MNHTKEPWTVRVDNHDGVIRKDTSKYVVSVHSGNQYQDTICAMDNLERREDAAVWYEIYSRIVRCVNACAGITNEALDAGIVDDLVITAMRSGMYWYKDGVEILKEDV